MQSDRQEREVCKKNEMKRVLAYCIVMAMAVSSGSDVFGRGSHGPSDPQASEPVRNLYYRMVSLMDKGVMIGHQDALAYGFQNYKPGASDVKKMTGDYPAVIGWDIGHLELGSDYNLDSVYFDTMVKYIRKTDLRGGITTVSWHCDNIMTGGSTWDCERNDVVRSVLPGQVNHEKFKQWLDRLAVFFKSLKNKNGEDIPVIFRLYHEHTGSWFWWGARQCTPQDYVAMWRMTVDYLRGSGVHNLLIAYSPSGCSSIEEYLLRYPGDDYVDVTGFDIYQNGSDTLSYRKAMETNIDIVTGYAGKSGKIPVISETGSESVRPDDYFTSVVYPLLENRRLSYILFWRNAYEPDKPGHFFLPFKGHSAEDDFKEMVSFPRVLLNEDIK